MTRRSALAALAAFAAAPAALLASAVASAQDFEKAEVRTEQLGEGLYVLFGVGGNVGLSVGDDAAFLVDDQYAPMAPKLRAAIAKLTAKPVQFVLNTHFHFDHTGGNEAFGQAGALIVAHDNVRRRMSSDQLMSFIDARQPKSPKVALPVVTVPGEIRFHLNGDEIHAFHVPNAHTDGDLVVHFRRADVVHMGDVFFNGFYPFIDTGSGGSADGVVAAFDRVLALAGNGTRIIPGHGPVADKARLAQHREMLATVAARIRALRAAGRSDDEILAAAPSAPYDAAYGGGFIKPEAFVRMMLAALPR